MKRLFRVLLIVAGVLVVLVGGTVALVAFLFPPARLKTLVETQVSRASGYAVQLEEAHIGWAGGLGLAVRVRDLTAEAPDGSQSIRAPRVKLQVALMPLLGRRLEVKRLTVDDLELRLRPVANGAAAGSPGGPAGGAGAASSPAAVGVLFVPQLELNNGRIVQEGSTGTNTLSALHLTGSFRQTGGQGHFEGEGRAASFEMLSSVDGRLITLAPLALKATFDGTAATGQVKGELAADSLTVVLRSPVAAAAAGRAATRPLRMVGPRATFDSGLRFGVAPDAHTTFSGRLGSLPFQGTVDSRQIPPAPAWKNEGEVRLSAVTLDSLKTLLPAEWLAPLKTYALGGRLEGGTLRFKDRAESDSLDYTFTTRLTEVSAALAGKGRVIDDGQLDVTATPERTRVAGTLHSGSSTLQVDGWAGAGDRAPWQAAVQLTGPAAEALRFLPAQGAPELTAGRLDLDLRLAGQLGATTAPSATGRLALQGVALRHPSLATAVSRLDLKASFTGDRAVIESGQIVAGKSSAGFKGEVTDFKHPAARLDIAAGTVDLDELFPSKKSADARGPGAAPPASAGLPVSVSGRITMDRLIRDRVVMSQLGADYSVSAAGMEMKNLTAQAWGGRVTGNLLLRPAGNEALDYSGDFVVSDAKLADMLTAVSKIRGIDGKIGTGFKLSGRNGPSINPLTAFSLEATSLVVDGALVNVPAVQKVAAALHLAEASAASFPFKTLKSRFKVTNGFVVFDSCRVVQANADWSLAGRLGLDGSLDLPVQARVATSVFATGSDLRKAADLLAGPEGRLPLAFRITGTLTSPAVELDLAPLMKQAQEKAKGGVTDEIKKRLGGLFKKPGS